MCTAEEYRIIPDSILENFACVACSKYLTIGPIGIHTNGGNICGRCLYGNKEAPSSTLFETFENSFVLEDYIPVSMFAYISYSNSLFPCVNRYEGCKEFLTYPTIKKHEESCKYQTYVCPICQFEGVGSQQIYHFKTKHRQYFLENTHKIVVNLRNQVDVSYLLKLDNNLYFVHVQYSASESLLCLNIRQLVTKGFCDKCNIIVKVHNQQDNNFEIVSVYSQISSLFRNKIEDVCTILNNPKVIVCEIFKW